MLLHKSVLQQLGVNSREELGWPVSVPTQVYVLNSEDCVVISYVSSSFLSYLSPSLSLVSSMHTDGLFKVQAVFSGHGRPHASLSGESGEESVAENARA